MQLQYVAWLATVLSTASAQIISIDDYLNGGFITEEHASSISAATTANDPELFAKPAATTTNDPELLGTRAMSYDNNVSNVDRNPDDIDNEVPEDYSGDEETTQSSNDNTKNTESTNGNGSDQELTTVENSKETEQVTESQSGNSNENGGEVSVEVEQERSNEVPLSNEYISREATGVVATEGGLVQGYYKDSNISSYIDIPYGKFRKLFEAPTVADPWESLHDANVHEKRCPQIDENGNFTGSIDCLTLSVFAPKNVENAAVLFHIHDGDFNIGSADHNIYGPEYLVTKGIILVLPNYRLGVLGFLCLNDDVAPGNAGLKDLTLALEWTWKNIASFGGNASKITVSADGRSGALAGYLALSPISRPYINGVITESGSMLAHWAIDRHPNTTATLLDEEIQQQLGNDIEIETLVEAAQGIHFRPCLESGVNAFMNETPWEILHHEGQKLDIPFIIGSANHAGLQEAIMLFQESLSDIDKNFINFLPDDLQFKNGKEKDAAEEIKKLYFKNNSISLEQIERISLLYTDAYYLVPSIRASRALLAAGAKVYFYEFSFLGELNRVWQSLDTTVQGAARGDLTCYTFMQDEEGPGEGTIEETMVNLITELWVSFLQTGVPSTDQITWKNLEKVEDKKEEWLSISDKVEQKTGLHVERLKLWTNIYDQHFIERNLAIEIRSCTFLIVSGILLLTIRK